MADNVAITEGSGTTVHADEYTHSVLGSGKTQLIKLVDGTLDSSTAIAAGGGVEAGALRVTIATDSTGVMSVDDNGSTISIDDGASSLTIDLAGNAVDVNSGNKSNGTMRVVLATDQPTLSNALKTDPFTAFGEYETVAASQTAQVLGATGGTGDYISGVLVIPATTSPGNVLLLDNATSITIFAGGTNSVSNLVPFFIPLGMVSVSGAWKLTTGANVSCIGIGNFT